MPVEGEHQRNGLMLAGVGDGLPDDLLMAEMHAVKKTDGQADLAVAGFQLGGVMNQFHLSGKAFCVLRFASSRNCNVLDAGHLFYPTASFK
jgi:hypothetical protein